MDVLGHEDVSIDLRLMPCPNLLHYDFYGVLGAGFLKEWIAVKAAKRDEVKGLSLLESPQAVWHGSGIIAAHRQLKTRSSQKRDERDTARRAQAGIRNG
jgi:hypothetical protein